MSVTPVPDDVLCRVLVADQFPLSLSPAGWPHDDKAKEVPPPFEAVSHMKTMNLAAVVADNLAARATLSPSSSTFFQTNPSKTWPGNTVYDEITDHTCSRNGGA
ncbi:hypothetical protein HFO97_27140 [Rhizobium leguminosarum]|uniref:hypothetical protein n=1 Tax=Rhizobium leguminosarum TaxID=384 RepID=UPI001C962265|nr:hypothetical protein [Rhizobium leguminosarum]MBY5363558.1 hypothetical protein [Rhizobium leguminosarum]